ncbi:MAG: imidazole glycerol phosphate synthase subunit HisH [Woeseiaceae bacterium]|nr:imidazole glycerol phosphate synthase subunit HisH [Woeseiaceae bacterium]
MANLAIIDSGGANIASLLYAFERLGVRADLTTDAQAIRRAPRVILPGVGAAADAMARLAAAGLPGLLRELEQPVLGICLGMQLLAETSAEGETDCLGVVPGTATRLAPASGYPVPNMGWCAVTRVATHPLFTDIDDGAYFYFLHSYALPVTGVTLATAEHSVPFSAVIGRDNFVATQFHPERSSAAGARLLENFLTWSP